MIPSTTIERIRETAHLPDIAGEYIDLKKRGSDWVGLCPFHAEKTPSFHVHEKFYKCFGCGVGGNVITFVSAIEGVGFPDAAKSLADRFGIAVDGPRVPLWKYKHERAEMAFAEFWKNRAIRLLELRLTSYVSRIDEVFFGTTEEECEAIGVKLRRVRAARGPELMVLMKRCATAEERAEYEQWNAVINQLQRLFVESYDQFFEAWVGLHEVWWEQLRRDRALLAGDQPSAAERRMVGASMGA